MTKKRYCKRCKWLRETMHPTEGFIVGRRCLVSAKVTDTFLEINVEYRNPKEINKNNDCFNYKRKWYLLWR